MARRSESGLVPAAFKAI